MTPKITIVVINLILALVVFYGLIISIGVFIAVRPFEAQLSSTEGVAQWRSHADMNVLGYKLDVDHVYISQDSTSEYYKMVSFRIPGAKYSYPTNTDSIKKVMKSKNDPSNIYTSVDLLGSELTLRVKDRKVQNYLLSGFIAFVIVAISLVTIWLWNFKKLIISLRKDETQFKQENEKRLRLLGMILLVFAFSHFTIIQLINLIIFSKFDFISSGNIRLDYNFPIVIIVFALAMLALSGVFNHGMKIKEDQDLTI